MPKKLSKKAAKARAARLKEEKAAAEMAGGDAAAAGTGAQRVLQLLSLSLRLSLPCCSLPAPLWCERRVSVLCAAVACRWLLPGRAALCPTVPCRCCAHGRVTAHNCARNGAMRWRGNGA